MCIMKRYDKADRSTPESVRPYRVPGLSRTLLLILNVRISKARVGAESDVVLHRHNHRDDIKQEGCG